MDFNSLLVDSCLQPYTAASTSHFFGRNLQHSKGSIHGIAPIPPPAEAPTRAGRPCCSSAAMELLLPTLGCRVINRKHGGFFFSLRTIPSYKEFYVSTRETVSLLSVTATKLRLINNHITREKPWRGNTKNKKALSFLIS